MRHAPLFLALALALPALAARADTPTPTDDATRDDLPAAPDGSGDDARTTRTLGTITVTGVRPTSLPTQIPTTMEGISGEQAEATINAIDAEDVLKYFPSLLVRKRYVGDFDHAVLATRASGTGNSTRSLVYADGILLSNLLGNGATFTPRWGLVAPEEIARVDVLYGPFSAAYPGNSVGAVVDYVTRMPQAFEAHAKLSHHHQDFALYRTRDSYDSTQASASIGDRWGAFSAWLAVNRLDSEGHPMVFANLLQSSGTSGSGTPVTGAVSARNPRNQPWYLLGASSIVETEQAHAKLKLAYDVNDDLRLSYTFGTWRNDVFRDSETWLRDAAGNPVYSGNVLIDGRRYVVPTTTISLQKADLEHRMHGLALKRSSGKTLDFTLAVSRYDYVHDRVRSPTVARPVADIGGAGRIADSDGTGWRSANAHLVWRPNDAHVVEFGVQDDRFTLDTEVRDTSDWRHGTPGARFSAFGGKAALTGVFAQDTWRWSERWTGTFGLRVDRWRAHDGLLANATTVARFGERRETALSPKAALAFAFTPDTSLQASVGRAVRFPTVSELYQGSLVAGSVVNNDPNLKAERSTTSELSLVHTLGSSLGMQGRLRATVFHERTRDALYSQTNVLVTPSITNIQNVDAIRTTGVELAGEWRDLGIEGLELTGSVTFADSIIRENPNFPASEGKRQPRVPRWRANLLASYAPSAQWQFTAGARYSGRQFNTLDNSDPNGDAYTGTSPFFVMDLRARWRPDEHWGIALGVDNLNDRTYWNFHPYTQRTWVAELRYDWR